MLSTAAFRLLLNASMLMKRNVKCFDIFFTENSWHEPRQCDYDGRYYCTSCHWDSLAVIPARVVHNWDFTERKVCCSCSHFLRLMMNKPVINIDVLNSQLFQFVEDLAAVKVRSSDILNYFSVLP